MVLNDLVDLFSKDFSFAEGCDSLEAGSGDILQPFLSLSLVDKDIS